MKKILIFTLLTLTMALSVFAVGPNAAGVPLDYDGDGIANYDDPDFEKVYANQVNNLDDDGDGVPNGQDEDYVPTGNGRMVDFQNQMRSSKQEFKGESIVGQGTQSGQKLSGSRGTIEGLKAMNQFTDSEFGRQVSDFARNYENSYNNALMHEEKIENRSAVSKFLFGGDKETATQLREQVGSNNEEISALRTQLSNAGEDEAVIISEQIDLLQAECDRLGELADKESSRKGLFKWW